jgi:Ca2+-binding RTX toxin-like protein
MANGVFTDIFDGNLLDNNTTSGDTNPFDLNDIIVGDNGNDYLRGLFGNDTLFGNAGSDVLEGGAGLDDIYGGDDKDYLYGNTDNDTLRGENGDDLLWGDAGNDSIVGGLGTDRVYEEGDFNYTLTNTQLTGDGTDVLNSIEAATIFAGAGNNNINATAFTGSTILYGSGGNDFIRGGSGVDDIYGGDQNDSLYGYNGNDTLRGENGDDFLWGDAGNDSIVGGAGIDRVYESGNFNYTLTNTQLVGDGTDVLNSIEAATIYAGVGNNNINASAFTGSTILYGLSGNDSLGGGSGVDNIYGGDGNDSILGGAGADTLTGGLGADTLGGGTGSDRYVFDTGAAFNAATMGIDRINGFDQSGFPFLALDKIVLDKTTFTSLNSVAGAGFSVASEFATVGADSQADDSAAEIVYNFANGNLFYNPDGAVPGFGTGGQFATISPLPNPSLDSLDFIIQN